MDKAKGIFPSQDPPEDLISKRVAPRNDPLLPEVHDDDVIIFHSENEDGLEMANYFSLHLSLHSKLEKVPAEHLAEQISGSHLPV